MHVATLWRYPVKSLAGEPLSFAELTPDGVHGDRRVHVRGRGGPLTGRTRHGLLTLPASLDRPGNRSWPATHGAPRRPQRFDIANLLLAVDGELDAFARRHGTLLDVRRLRPNIVLDGVSAEEVLDWPGSAIAIGDALIGVHSQRQRCIVTSIDPDSGAQDLDVFRRIRRDFAGFMALNCWVATPGTVRPGDRAELVPTAQRPRHLGGWIAGAPYRAG